MKRFFFTFWFNFSIYKVCFKFFLLVCFFISILQFSYGNDTLKIFEAASSGDTELAQKLLDEDIDVYIRGGAEKATPLHVASFHCHTKTAEVFLNKMLLINENAANVKDDLNQTPLHYAVQNGCTKIALMLISRGADIEAENKYKQTPLFYAVVYNHIETAEMLLKKEANPNAKDDLIGAPLHIASGHGYTKMVNILIDYDADIRIRDKYGLTPLHHAAFGDHIEIAIVFLNRGVSPIDAENDFGHAPSDMAKSVEMENLLKSYQTLDL